MANTLTSNFGFRTPATGDTSWRDEFLQNQEIKDTILKNLIQGERLLVLKSYGIWKIP